jgi:multidrug transporter EmrE-like cation transporter
MSVFYLALAILCNVAANVLFKQASGLPGWSLEKLGIFGLGLAIGLANTLFYIKALEDYALSVAYPIFMAGSVILITALSAWIFREYISIQKAAGLGAICVGLLLLWKS